MKQHNIIPLSDIKKPGSGNIKEGIYNDQIDEVMKDNPDYLGTIARDQIPLLVRYIRPHSRGAFILNLDKHNQPGSHWVSVYFDARKGGSNTIEYFNSFGDPIPKDLLPDIKKISDKLNSPNYLQLKENRVREQRANSANCGYFAMRFVKDRFAGKKFKDITPYSDVIRQEHEIQQFKKKLPDFTRI